MANDPFLDALATEVGAERITVALDSMNGRIVVKGWQESTRLAAEAVLSRFKRYCTAFLCTYVDSEGTMEGTDLDWYRRLRTATTHEITAAGGIGTLEDVRTLLDIGVHVAVGMAVYTGRFDLATLAAMQPRAVPASAAS